MRLKFAKSATAQTDGRNFWYEARVDHGNAATNQHDFIIVFRDDADGTFAGHGDESDKFPADGSMDQSLRWFIENDRAMYINRGVSLGSGGGASEFTTLTDTPSAFDAGSYLRVNAAGDAIEQVKTAPPDGGAGDHSLIQTASNFAGKIPDALIIYRSDVLCVYRFNQIGNGKIVWVLWTDVNATDSYYVE